jgi:hypothetical protein
MNTYNGQAVIVTEDDAEIAVTAALRRHRNGLRTDWSGTLAPATESLRKLANLTGGRVRLPNGKEASFLRPDTSDWVTSKRLTIIGQDDAPF